MTKNQKINEKIAKHFGFEKSKEGWEVKGYRETGMHQWTFPDGFYLPQGGVPNFNVPDFITLLEDYLKQLKANSAFGKREYFGLFDKEK